MTMRKLIIAVQAVAIVALLLCAIGNAFAHDWGNAAISIAAAILVGRV
jgi:hypothetical protein